MYVCRLIHFFLKYTATAKIYTYGHTLSLHDALPILFGEYPIMINSVSSPYSSILRATASASGSATGASFSQSLAAATPTSGVTVSVSDAAKALRSEEHTSELPSLMRISFAVFCLNKTISHHSPIHLFFIKLTL